MARHYVTVHETKQYEISIDADTVEEAAAIAREMYDDGGSELFENVNLCWVESVWVDGQEVAENV